MWGFCDKSRYYYPISVVTSLIKPSQEIKYQSFTLIFDETVSSFHRGYMSDQKES